MNVLSLFDGMSCGQIALNQLGIEYENYFASEIDAPAISVTQRNYPNTIQLGSVVKVNVKSLYLSEVYEYICGKYFNNDIYGLQSIISEREMLHRINEKQTFTAYFGAQDKEQKIKKPANPIVSINDRIWFWRNKMGSDKSIYDIIRCGERRAQPNCINVGDLCKYSFWWNGDGQSKSETEGASVKRIERKGDVETDKNETKLVSKKTILKSNEQGDSKAKCDIAISRPNQERKIYAGIEKNDKRKGGKKETHTYVEKRGDIQEVKRSIPSVNEDDRIGKDNEYFLLFYSKIQVTVVECEWGVLINKGDIKICIGGSPCQSFSFAGKRKGMSTKDEIEILTLDHYLELKNEQYEFEGQSYLFWEYMRILSEIRKKNPEVYFFLENVEMGEKWEKVLSRAIGVNGIHINSSLLSAQNRERIYWLNWGLEAQGLFGDLYSSIPQPKDKGLFLRDVYESNVNEKYYLSEKAIRYLKRTPMNQRFMQSFEDKKGGCVTANYHKGVPYNVIIDNRCVQVGQIYEGGSNSVAGRVYSVNGKAACLSALGGGGGGKTGLYLIDSEEEDSKAGIGDSARIRRLTPLECERLQTVPEGYTASVRDTNRYKMLGNGWTVEVIKFLFSYLPFYKSQKN